MLSRLKPSDFSDLSEWEEYARLYKEKCYKTTRSVIHHHFFEQVMNEWIPVLLLRLDSVVSRTKIAVEQSANVEELELEWKTLTTIKMIFYDAFAFDENKNNGRISRERKKLRLIHRIKPRHAMNLWSII